METSFRRILVVDDNEIVRSVVAKMIAILGYEVLATDCGENGWNLFLKNHFDLVITDFEMPGMDGIELAIRIKEKSPFTLVILMTGHEKDFTLAKLSGTFVDQALFKPFGLQDIAEKIQSVQNRYHSVKPPNPYR